MKDDPEYENSGQAFEADIYEVIDVEETEKNTEDNEQEEDR